MLTNNSFSPIRFASNEALEDSAADYDAKYQEENVESGETVCYFNVYPVIQIYHISKKLSSLIYKTMINERQFQNHGIFI